MGQLGFFDLNRRYESLTEKNDPLVAIAAMVPFESLRPKLNAALIKGELRRSEAERKNSTAANTWLSGAGLTERRRHAFMAPGLTPSSRAVLTNSSQVRLICCMSRHRGKGSPTGYKMYPR